MATIRINFDSSHNPETPTLVLAHRSGKKIGGLKAQNITVNDCLNTASEISFEIYKYFNGELNELWDEIQNFKLVWCKEWNVWFEITIECNESDGNDIKTVSGTRLGVAELSQIKLYDYQINTESDIERDDYKPTVLYNPSDPSVSLLDRLLEKAPHYSVRHIDSSIIRIQRTYEFDDISIYDAFQEIAEEIGCLFVFHSDSNIDGSISRQFSVYDLESNCHSCGYRGDFTTVCPECGSREIEEGYGEDTTIFLTSDELSNDILFTSDTPSMKNCFKLEGGDDLMTAAIRSCNPNGTDYIWHRTKDMEDDMSKELVEKLDSYDKLYAYYQTDYATTLNKSLLDKYNELVTKYRTYNEDLETITSPIIGFPALMAAYFNTIDLSVYLQSALMPDGSLIDTTAEEQASLLTRNRLSPVAVTNLSVISKATADNAILGMAKVLIDSRYQVKIGSSSISNNIWSGNFIVTNYSNEDDYATTNNISVNINDDYELYVKQKIKKSLNKDKKENTGIVELFESNHDIFCKEIKKYCLDSLNIFISSCQSAIDILIEQGVATAKTWSGRDPDLYADLYLPYYNKLQALQEEATLRQSELDIISGTYNVDNELISNGLQTEIEEIRNTIQDTLDFQKYIGKDLWLEFCAYRREDKFSNSNYISDGLNNAELFDRALEFHKLAAKEIYKSSELQHSISASLKDLLFEDKFEPILDYFEVGNWLRIQFDDKIYKLRLIKYEVDYDNIENILLEFSSVTMTADGMSDIQSVLSQTQSMASSYDTVQRQSEKGAEGNGRIKNWIDNGLDATNTKIIGGADYQSQTWDSHGMLFRRYNPFADTYDDIQLKIVNSTLAITDDNWRNVKTAVGAFYYFDPNTNELKYAYGINAEVLIGKLILGNELGIYSDNNLMTFDNDGLKITNDTNTFTVNPNSKHLVSLSNSKDEILYVDEKGLLHIQGEIQIFTEDNSMTFDKNGLRITNDVNTFVVNPNSQHLFSLTNVDGEILYVDERGKLHIQGDGAGLDITANDSVKQITSQIEQTAESITQTVKSVENLETQISQDLKSITLSVTNGSKSSTITLTGDGITTQSKTIQFTGDIIFASDLVDGVTRISGSNIKTGNIDANLITSGKIQSKNGRVYFDLDNNEISCNKLVSATAGTTYPAATLIFNQGYNSSFGYRTYLSLYNDGYGSQGMNFYIHTNQYNLIESSSGLELRGGTNAYITIHGSGTLTNPSAGTSQKYVALVNGSNKILVADDGDIELDGAGVYLGRNVYITRSGFGYDSSASPVGFTSAGKLVQCANGSTQKIKHDIKDVVDDILQPERLYKIPVKQFIFNSDYLSENDERYGKSVIGLIAEDVEKYYPIAVIHDSEGNVETWQERYIIPAMLALIQKQKNQLDKQTEQISNLLSRFSQLEARL